MFVAYLKVLNIIPSFISYSYLFLKFSKSNLCSGKIQGLTFETALSLYLGRIGKNGKEKKSFYWPQKAKVEIYVQV